MIAYSRTFFLLTAAAMLAGCSKESAPSGAAKLEHAPDSFRVKFETSKGDIVVQVNKEWAPLGAQRFFELVQSGFFDNGHKGRPFQELRTAQSVHDSKAESGL